MAFRMMMRRLGYERYGAVGNDWGAHIAPEIDRAAPTAVVGVHLTQIFAQTLSDDDATRPETGVARGDRATEIAGIKAEPGPDVTVWGGGRLTGALAAADLIDEYRLLVQPLILGRGQALFDQTTLISDDITAAI